MFNRRALMQSLAVLAAPGVVVRAWARGAEPALPKPGVSLALPALTLFDGRAWSPSTVAGKTLVVYWWASWCPFCAIQSPHMEALWRANRDQGLEMLALSMDKEPAAAVNYIKNKAYSFPAGLVTPAVAKVLPKPAGLPVVVVLKVAPDGRSGRVVFAEAGEMFPEDVEGLKKYI